MRLRPMYDRLLVRRNARPEESPGGIIIPEAHQKKQHEGVVIRVGDGAIQKNGTVRPLDVKVGDVVVFDMFSGEDYKVEGERVLMLKESEVLGIKEAA